MAIEMSRLMYHEVYEPLEPFEPPRSAETAAAAGANAAPAPTEPAYVTAAQEPAWIEPESRPGWGDGTPNRYGPPPLRTAANDPVQATAPPTPAATPAPGAPAASAAPAATAGYVGERPVDAAWLADREAALLAVRSDYEAQRNAAAASGGTGPGWVDAVLVTDESGQTRSVSGAPTAFIPDPGATPQLLGYDEGGPIYGGVTGRTVEFSEEAFAAQYRAQAAQTAGSPLQTLARSYDTDAATLLAQHPGIWALATQDHALNAGPAPAGRAMGDPAQLATLDLYMADPQVAELIQRYGGNVAPATSGIAQEQVRIYGQARYEQITGLGQAMQSVRSQYSAAMQQAQASGQGPGWVEHTAEVVVHDEGGVTHSSTVTTRGFDPDAFTRWYTAQDGAANKAFASFYGQSHTQWSTDESGNRVVAGISFDNPNWSLWGAGGPMAHRELVSLDPNHTPRLNSDSAVGFDLEAGWATHHSNIHQKRDWFDTVVQVAIVAVVSYVSAGTLGAAAASAVGGGIAGTVASAAVVGATASAVSGAMNGNLTFKGVLQGALSGALSAGLMNTLGPAVASAAGTAGTIALRATVQGGINALLGGKFRDGAVAGLASGLAEQAGASLNQGIDDALKNGSMTAAEAVAARTMARVFTSAVRALGNPSDPSYAFASDLVNGVVGDGLTAGQTQTPPPVVGTAFDDDGNLMPGVVDRNAPLADQVAQLRSALIAQGLPPDQANGMAWQRLAPLPDPFTVRADTDVPTRAEELAEQIGVPPGQIVDAGLIDDLGRSAEVLRGFAEGAGFSILSTGEALLEVAKSPMQFARGVKALLTSAEARSQFSQDFIDRVRVDVQMLEDAFNAGDMRATGQQLGKLTTDFAQLAGGVEALARLGVTATTASGRLLAGTVQAIAPALSQVRDVFARLGTQVPDDVAVRIASNFGREGDAFTQVAEQMAQARAAGWQTAEGRIWYPPSNGAVPGTQFTTTLQPGAIVDRFGGTGPNSTFLAPAGTPIGQRALAPNVNTAISDRYEVLRPLSVEQSNAVPWFGQSGMGIQYDTAGGAMRLTIEKLVEAGYLRRIGP